MDSIGKILGKLEDMLISLGFKEVEIETRLRTEKHFVLGNTYCVPEYVEGLGFLMEYAEGEEEARNYGHEDGDSFPLHMGETAIIEGLKAEVIKDTPELAQANVPLSRVI